MGTTNGRDHYLGSYETPESRELYDRLIAEWLASGRRTPMVARQDITVTELIAAYWPVAKAHYRQPDGRATSALPRVRSVLS